MIETMWMQRRPCAKHAVMKTSDILQIPADMLLAEELASDDVVEMANLTTLPVRVFRQMSPQVINWVSRNKDALLDFWYQGDTWTQPEVNDFIQKLDRV